MHQPRTAMIDAPTGRAGIADGLRIVPMKTTQLQHAFRVTVAAVATYALGQLFHVHLVLWSVLTAVVVTRLGAGETLKTTIEYFVGTICGAAFAGLVATLIPHAHESGVLVVLAVAVAPLALLAAMKPAFTAAPFTAAVVVLAPMLVQASPFQSAYHRVFEVALGASVAVAASFLTFPAARVDRRS